MPQLLPPAPPGHRGYPPPQPPQPAPSAPQAPFFPGSNNSNNSINGNSGYGNSGYGNSSGYNGGNGGGYNGGGGGGGVVRSNFSGMGDAALPRVPGLGAALRGLEHGTIVGGGSGGLGLGGGGGTYGGTYARGGAGGGGGFAGGNSYGGGSGGGGGGGEPQPDRGQQMPGFVSGSDQYRVDQMKERLGAGGGGGGGANNNNSNSNNASNNNGIRPMKRGMGLMKKPPQQSDNNGNGNGGNNSNNNNANGGAPTIAIRKHNDNGSGGGGSSSSSSGGQGQGHPSGSKILSYYESRGLPIPDVLKNCDPAMIVSIENEIVEFKPGPDGEPPPKKTMFDDIAGLDYVKACLYEAVIYPMVNPGLFSDPLLQPPRGVLMYGPPGTGKTLIGKAAACECNATFFSISASSLVSKWIGDGEKMVRTLFAVAQVKAPSIIFIDEIDSMLSSRSESEHESSRRIKTQFLVEMEGLTTGYDPEKLVLIIGATNRPQELDEAARRRFVKRFYVPLPEPQGRESLIRTLTAQSRKLLSDADIDYIVKKTEGYSGADVAQVCREAAMSAVRRGIDGEFSDAYTKADVPPMNREDFDASLSSIHSSVSPDDVKPYLDFDKVFGTKPSQAHIRSFNAMMEKRRREKAAAAAAAATMAAAAAAISSGAGAAAGAGAGGAAMVVE